MNMKTEDPFEQRLRCQTLRQVPSEWRAEILAAADASRLQVTKQPTAAGEVALIEWWRLWFSRFPLAWSALAAIWITVIGINFTLPAPFVSISALVSPSARAESLTAMNFPTLELDSMPMQIAPPPKPAPDNKPPANPPRPRSERCRDLDYCCIASSHTTFRQIA